MDFYQIGQIDLEFKPYVLLITINLLVSHLPKYDFRSAITDCVLALLEILTLSLAQNTLSARYNHS